MSIAPYMTTTKIETVPTDALKVFNQPEICKVKIVTRHNIIQPNAIDEDESNVRHIDTHNVILLNKEDVNDQTNSRINKWVNHFYTHRSDSDIAEELADLKEACNTYLRLYNDYVHVLSGLNNREDLYLETDTPQLPTISNVYTLEMDENKFKASKLAALGTMPTWCDIAWCITILDYITDTKNDHYGFIINVQTRLTAHMPYTQTVDEIQYFDTKEHDLAVETLSAEFASGGQKMLTLAAKTLKRMFARLNISK